MTSTSQDALTHYAAKLGTICGQPGPTSSAPTCEECKSIVFEHPYLGLSSADRAEMAQIQVQQVDAPDRR